MRFEDHLKNIVFVGARCIVPSPHANARANSPAVG